MNIGERLKHLRTQLLDEKFTMKSFGEQLGVSGDVIKNIEYNRVEVKDHMIKLICQTFNVNEEWLRNGVEPIFKEKENNNHHINELIKRYDINQDEIDIIKRFANLDENSRNKIINFVFNMVKENIDKIDDDKILKFAKEPPGKVKIVARGKGVTYEDADRINEIIENAEEVNLDDIDFL